MYKTKSDKGKSIQKLHGVGSWEVAEFSRCEFRDFSWNEIIEKMKIV